MRKKVLILGGTSFVGRCFVEQLILYDKYEIILFNRGISNNKIFPRLKTIIGDRETDGIKQLANSNWDFVVDFSSYFPGSLERLIDLLKDRVGRYIYVSTISTYDLNHNSDHGVITEDASTLLCSSQEQADTSIYSYGARKAECERVTMGACLDSIIFRPSIIYGSHDPTDRLYYWLYRIKNQNEILIPANCETLLNMTYVKDFAKVLVKALTIDKHQKVYNIPTHKPSTFKAKLETIASQLHARPIFVEIKEKEMEQEQLHPWMDIPVYINFDRSLSNERLLNDFNCKLTSFEQSIKETIDYYEQFNWREGKYGLRSNREIDIIRRQKKNAGS